MQLQIVTTRAWIVWLIAGIFYLYEFIHRVMISVMIPELSVSFKITSSTIGNLSAFYFYAYAIAQIPVGLLIDFLGTRKILVYSCLLITVSSFIFSITSNILIAIICRLFIGLGSSSAFVGCLKIASSCFSMKKVGLVIGLTNLLGVAGAIIGGKPIAIIVAIFNWRVVMFMSSIIGLILTVLLRIEYKNIINNNNNSFSFYYLINTLISRIVNTCKNEQNWFIAIFASLMVAPIITYSELWGVHFLNVVHNIERPKAAEIVAITFIGIGIGSPIIGYISDYFKSRKFFILIGLLGAIVFMSLIIFNYQNFTSFAFYILHIAFGFFSSSMLLCFSLISESTNIKHRATAVGLINSIIMILGAILQTISGKIIEHSGNFFIGFIPIFICYICAFILFFFLKESKRI